MFGDVFNSSVGRMHFRIVGGMGNHQEAVGVDDNIVSLYHEHTGSLAFGAVQSV